MSGPRPESSLLQSLQTLLERTYRMETGIDDVARYVIGDQGYRAIYGSRDGQVLTAGWGAHRVSETAPGGSNEASDGADRVLFGTRAGGQGPPGAGLRSPCGPGGRYRASPAGIRTANGAGAGAGARVLVREETGTIAARIYYPDALIRALEEDPPLRGIGERNIDPFAVFVEELDHFLLIAERARLGRPVTLLELEMHANVTKYLVCALFLAASRRRKPPASLGEEDRLWLRWHLFEKIDYAEPDPAVQARYRSAARFARRFLDRLDGEPDARSRLALLRTFHDATHQAKLAAVA